MTSLVKYVAINTTDTSTNGFYVIMFTSRAYILQENTTIDGKIITAGELVGKSKYLCSMQVDTNWYWNQKLKQHFITVPTCKILHLQLEVNGVIFFTQYPQVFVPGHKKKSMSRQPFCLTDSDNDYNLEEIGRREKIEFERYVEVYSADEED